MNYKPFDLQRWRNGDKIMFRDGHAILDMHYFESPSHAIKMPIHALCWDGSFTCHYSNGRFTLSEENHPRDIVMAPKEVEYWVATGVHLKQGLGYGATSFHYKSEVSATDNLLAKYPSIDKSTIQTHKITRYE